MINRNASTKHGPRRIILMSSAAGLALALLIAGPGGHLAHTMLAWSSHVRAARIAAQHGAKVAKAAEATQPAADFAGLVAKVNPTVISVGVQLDVFENEEDQESERGNGNIPMEPGSPMEKVFPAVRVRPAARVFTTISRSPVRLRDFFFG